jgi:hypothetical protein
MWRLPQRYSDVLPSSAYLFRPPESDEGEREELVTINRSPYRIRNVGILLACPPLPHYNRTKVMEGLPNASEHLCIASENNRIFEGGCMNSLKNGHYQNPTYLVKFTCFALLLTTACPPVLAEIDFFTNDSYAFSAVRYKLAEGSILIDDTDILMRPTLMVPIQGSFYLKRLPSNPLFTNYAIQDLRLKSTTSDSSYTGKFNGTYRYGGEFALTQQMILKGYINNSPLLTLDSYMTVPTIRYPWIEIDLVQVDPNNPFQYYRLHLVAAPWPKIWFSTSTSFTTSSGIKIGHGDLLSMSGMIVRRNNQLTARLGIMPMVPDFGLDAVMLGKFSSLPLPMSRYRPVWFSLPQDVNSMTLGLLHNGDLLSEQGTIVKSYEDFISPFVPMPLIEDYGLDAIARAPSGELLFSTNKNFFSEKLGRNISNGDLLSENGYVYRSSVDLLSKFVLCPTFAPIDIGLDAAYVWPHGEVWFSTKSSFPDQQYGMIGHGDLLSSYGKVVLRNRELLERFAPIEDLADFGLDALEILWPNLAADLNDDGVVDLIDYSIFARSWMSSRGNNRYNSICDIVDDNSVDMHDAVAFSEDWLAEVE